MGLFVSDIDRAVALWRDVMGFEVGLDTMLPDDTMDAELLDDIWGVRGAQSRCVVLASSGGAILELQQSLNPPIERTPPETLGYLHTGIHELGLLVEDIDSWFEKIRAAGYETQTDYVWSNRDGRSFLFYDQDGNLIQLWESGEGDRTRELLGQD